MRSDSDIATARVNAAICANEADDLETLIDYIAQWQGVLEDSYRLGMTDAAGELHDALSNLAGKMQREADNLREEAHEG